MSLDEYDWEKETKKQLLQLCDNRDYYNLFRKGNYCHEGFHYWERPDGFHGGICSFETTADSLDELKQKVLEHIRSQLEQDVLGC